MSVCSYVGRSVCRSFVDYPSVPSCEVPALEVGWQIQRIFPLPFQRRYSAGDTASRCVAGCQQSSSVVNDRGDSWAWSDRRSLIDSDPTVHCGDLFVDRRHTYCMILSSLIYTFTK